MTLFLWWRINYQLKKAFGRNWSSLGGQIFFWGERTALSKDQHGGEHLITQLGWVKKAKSLNFSLSFALCLFHVGQLKRETALAIKSLTSVCTDACFLFWLSAPFKSLSCHTMEQTWQAILALVLIKKQKWVEWRKHARSIWTGMTPLSLTLTSEKALRCYWDQIRQAVTTTRSTMKWQTVVLLYLYSHIHNWRTSRL